MLYLMLESIHEFLVVFLPFSKNVLNILTVMRQGSFNLAIGSVFELDVVDLSVNDLHIRLDGKLSWSLVLPHDFLVLQESLIDLNKNRGTSRYFWKKTVPLSASAVDLYIWRWLRKRPIASFPLVLMASLFK